MDNMLDNLPLNTDCAYVGAIAGKSGCQIFVPVKAEEATTEKRDELIEFLKEY